jgi:hypothetical protein
VPPVQKRAKVGENEITVVGYESREPVVIVKVEPKEKGRGKKGGATDGADVPVPPAKKRAKKDDYTNTVNGFQSPKELVSIVKVEPKEKGRGKKGGATADAGGPVPPAKKRAKKRVKCDHGRDKRFCRECGGSGICPHGKLKQRCRECGGSALCTHGRMKRTCRECGGSAVCVHGKRKERCKQCGGSALCTHGRIKRTCRECGGSAICVHGKRKERCKDCLGKAQLAGSGAIMMSPGQ